MLARKEDRYESVSLTPEEERQALRQTPQEPLFKTVLDTSTRSRCQVMFLTATVLAMLVTIGSGISASRGYALVEMQQQAEALEQENERLKIDIARLKSPERIKNIAKEQLDMEVPKHTYFSQEK